jgi:hypothetical protein
MDKKIDFKKIENIFKDICKNNKHKIITNRGNGVYRKSSWNDLKGIENDVISYAWDNLSKSEYKYMNDLFKNFKKGV